MDTPSSSGLPDPFALEPDLEALLLRMIEQRPDDPQAWAEAHAATAGQSQLLLALFQSHDAGSERQQARRQRLAARLPELAQAAWMPEHIGEWQLVRPIGRGGMSWVFLARRERDGFSQLGALKLLPGGPGPLGAEARFANERAILASLEHSGIARLIDGGVSEQGLPWLVMEWVDGSSLDEFCDGRRLDPPSRLALVQQVLDVVQYAHGQLVVHRDIKPSNILVGAKGAVKLLDFGIARVLDAVADPGGDTELTRQTGRLLSPGWASPEQVAGGPVGVASDVYSLGVLLYRLLTGLSPYGAGPTDEQAVLKAVVEQTPLAPSKAVMKRHDAQIMATFGWRRARLARYLRGDLDLIILTCLRKEPGRRYASVAELAADLEGFRQQRPIAARKDHLAYTTGRFLSRHRYAALTSLLVALSLITGLVLHTQRLTEARDQAEQAAQSAALEADKSGRIAAFLTDLFRAADPTAEVDQTLSALDLVERGLDRLDELAGTPRIQAEMLAVFADVKEARGRYLDAAELYRQALKLIADLPPTELGALPARLHTSLAVASYHGGDAEAARGAVDAALEALADQDAARPRELAAALNLRGNLLRDAGRADAAESDYRRAIVLYADLPDQAVARSTAQINLGVLLSHQRRLIEARALFEQALASRQAELGPDHPWTSIPAGNLASILTMQGEFAAAEALYSQALADRIKVLGDAHPRVAAMHNLLGKMHLAANDPARAEPHLEAAEAIWQASLGPGHRHSLLNRLALAELALLKNDLAQAEREALATQQAFSQLHGQSHPDQVQALHLAGRIASALNRPEESLSYHQQALQMQESLNTSGHALTESLLLVAEAATAMAQGDLARKATARAADLIAEAVEPDPRQARRLAAMGER
ncbi:MAG: serine/threonine protein kinase [Wenzhouxiangella sp.]|nr:serine/threonine protein kinase [Wenzhouxiangella sp.]